MIPETTNFASIERFIKKHPREADALAFKWREFAKIHPEAASFQTADEFYPWAAQRHEIDRDILFGYQVQNVYFYLREKHEDRQMQTEGRVNPSVVPAEFPYLPLLAIAFLRDRPKIMENDRDYQKIAEQLKKLWLEKNPGKDFTSKEGLDYLYGSLENNNTPMLRKDAEKIFRDNSKHQKRIEKYDNEKNKIYKNPNDDPIVANLKRTVGEHTKARQQLHGTPADIDQVIQKQSLERFIKEYPEKASVYTKKGGNIVSPQEKQGEKEEKRKKTLPERAKDIYDWYNRSRTPIRVGRTVGRFAERTTLNVARGGGRLAIQGGRAAITGVRAAIQGVMLAGRAGALLVSNPIGWIVIGVIVVIIIIVFLIILFAGGGGIGDDGKPVPTIECLDADGNVIIVTDGNTCALNYAAYYSKQEGITITAKCLDKCTDFVKNTCDRDSFNTCDPLNTSCGAPQATFCIEYTPANLALGRQHDCLTGGPGYVGTPLGVNSCGAITPTVAPTETPTPTPTP